LREIRYSETVDILYAFNMFYFRNPFTNWSFSSWKILAHRLQNIRILVLDETIGDPSLIFGSPKHWKHGCNIISSMARLRVLYFNIDTLYPRAWTVEREEKLLTPLRGFEIPELHVIVRWMKPEAGDGKLHASSVNVTKPNVLPTFTVVRVEDYEFPEQLYEAYPAADMRTWIVEKLALLRATDS
jgi:hypothetical protein